MFLGNYVDRGKQSIETICLLLAYKVKYPENFFLLRGNHESSTVNMLNMLNGLNRMYRFYDECNRGFFDLFLLFLFSKKLRKSYFSPNFNSFLGKRRYNFKLWKTFIDCFNSLPVAAIIGEKIFCVHGGLSPELKSLDQIKDLKRPIEVPDKGKKTFKKTQKCEGLNDLYIFLGLLCDLLWSDPDKQVQKWDDNEREFGFTFGPDTISLFLKKHDIDLICRGHQIAEDGYEFFANRQLVTISSASNYGEDADYSGRKSKIRTLC